MSELSRAITKLNESTDKTEVSQEYFDELMSAGDTETVTNPNNDITVDSFSKQIKGKVNEEVSDNLAAYVQDASDFADASESSATQSASSALASSESALAASTSAEDAQQSADDAASSVNEHNAAIPDYTKTQICYPNLFTIGQLNGDDLPEAINGTPSATVVDNTSAIYVSGSTGATAYIPVDLSGVDSGVISASVTIESTSNIDTLIVGVAEVSDTGVTSGLVEMHWEIGTATDITEPTAFTLTGHTLQEDTVSAFLHVFASDSTDTNMVDLTIHSLIVAEGTDSTFRGPKIADASLTESEVQEIIYALLNSPEGQAAVIAAINSGLGQTYWQLGDSTDSTAPSFTSPASALAIVGGTGAGREVYTAMADDESTIAFSIDNTDFSINTSSGVVTLIDNPDYATQSSYSFAVTATDTSGNSSSITVSLAITDPTGNLVVDGEAIQADDQWEYIGAGAWSYDGDGTANVLKILAQADQPQYLRVDFTVTAVSGNITYCSTGGDNITSTGSYYAVIDTSVNGAQQFKRTYGTASCTITDISITEATVNDVTGGVMVVEDTGDSGVNINAFDGITFDINSLTELEAAYATAVPTPPTYTLAGAGNYGETFAFTTNEILFLMADLAKRTLNTDYIDDAITTITSMFSVTDTERYNDGSFDAVYYQAPNHLRIGVIPSVGWTRAAGNGATIKILDQGKICEAICYVCDVIKDNTAFSAYTITADTFLANCDAILTEHDNEYLSKSFTDYEETYGAVDVEAYYWPSTDLDTTWSTMIPLNQPMGAHLAGLILDKWSVSSKYATRAANWFAFWRSDICWTDVVEDGNTRGLWLYGADTTSSSIVAEGYEDSNHLAFYIGKPYNWSRTNSYMGINATEMDKIGYTLLKLKETSATAYGKIDGTGAPKDNAEAYIGQSAWILNYMEDATDAAEGAQWVANLVNGAYTAGTSNYQLIRAFSDLLIARDA